MRGLTIRQPWAYAIAYLGKQIENRTWGTSYRGPMLIHAGLTLDDEIDIAFDVIEATIGRSLSRSEIEMATDVRGAIVAVADLVSVIHVDSLEKAYAVRPWGFGPYCWQLREVKPLREPLPAKGMQGLWPCSSSLAASAVNAAMSAAEWASESSFYNIE